MSRPQNPLNLYRSYSYHHILVACDGTETAEELARTSEITQFDHERAQKKFCPQSNTVGRYVVLVNGLSDTQFTIKSARWSSVLIPNETDTGEGSTHFRTMAVDGELEIHEPLGVNFLNLLNEITKSLGTDPNGVVFLLKTIFVGSKDDGQTEFIANIRPLLFIAYDISALFDVTGAEYTLAFVGVTNGAARLPHVSSVGDGFTFKMDPGQTLLAAFTQLKERLNTYYAEQKRTLSAQAECFGMESGFFENQFIDVTYDIIIDPIYRGEEYIVGDDVPPNQTDKGDGDAIVKKGGSISVEGLIDTIMYSSKRVKAEEADENENRHMHKITSTIVTGPDKYEVTYHVQRFQATVIPVEKFFTFEPPDGQGIEFDYIFTGRNIDIKTFDIKMQMGMAFLQTLSANPSLPTNATNIISHFNSETKVSGTGNSQGSGDQRPLVEGRCDDDARNQDVRRKKPLFLGMSIKDSLLRNRRLPGPATSYSTLLARHAAFENIEARMVIHGNPQLLEETTQYTGDLNPTITETQPAVITASGFEQLPDEEQLRNVWTAVHRLPAYLKVNVFMPNSSLAVKDPDSIFNEDFSQNFWYNGWYFVYGINHVFEDGEFTQEIEMFSLPTDASQGELGKSENKCDGTTQSGGTGGTGGQSAATDDTPKKRISDVDEKRKAASADFTGA